MAHLSDGSAVRLNQEFGRILEESLNEIYIFNAKTLNFIQVNRGGRENLGYSMAEMRKLTPLDLKPEFSQESYDQLVLPLREGQQRLLCFNTVHRRKDGSEYHVEVHLQLETFHDVPAFIAIILDTTERLHTEEELRVRNRAIEATGIGVVIVDAIQPEQPLISCNQAFEEITGYTKAEVIGRNCRFLQQEDRDQESRHLIREAIEQKQACRTLLRNYRKDGTLFWNELTISPVLNPKNELTHFVGLINDVTARIEAEEEIRERGARLRAILDTAVEAIISIDEHGICESVNVAAERMFGYTAEEMVGKNVAMLMPSPYREEHDQYLARYLRTGEKKIIGIGRDVTGQRKNGEQFPIRLSVSEVRFADRRLFTGIVQDITEQKESQRRLVQSERLAALGEAMARLAHESRNSLQRIQIAVETAQLYCEEGTSLADQLSAIERASDGLDALLDELKNYAAPLSLELKDVSLASIWREAWQATTSLRGGRVANLLEEIGTTEPLCHVDRFRMGQVFRNLFENSLAACHDPVQIEVFVSQKHTEQGSFWILRIRDNGPGLNELHVAKIFEPFFTTKTKGTGLGMAIAYRIIEAHGGVISVGSQNRGAEFIIKLPL